MLIIPGYQSSGLVNDVAPLPLDEAAYDITAVDVVPQVHDADGIVDTTIGRFDGDLYTFYRNQTYSVGRTWNLRSIDNSNRFTLPPGYVADDIVGIAFNSSNRVYAWYRDGKRSVGTLLDFDAYEAPVSYTTAAGQSPNTIVGIDISSNDGTYAWYSDGTRSRGGSRDLDAVWTSTYTPAAGKSYGEIAGIAIAPDNDHIFTLYRPHP